MWAETEMWPRREECQARLNPSLGDTSFSVMLLYIDCNSFINNVDFLTFKIQSKLQWGNLVTLCSTEWFF